MANNYNNKFVSVPSFHSTRFFNEIIDIKIKDKSNLGKEFQTLGFFLANMFAYEYDAKVKNKLSRALSISKKDDIYLIESENGSELFGVFPGFEVKGRGTIFELGNGIEIFYKEIRGNTSKKYHYQFVVEKLDNNESLIKAINCQNREVVECYLVDDSFQISDSTNRQLSGKGFKTLFKVR